MENRKTSRHSGTEQGRSRRSKEETASAPRTSVMDAVSKLDYHGYVPVESTPDNKNTRKSGSQGDLLSALGVQDSSVEVQVPIPSKSKSKSRDRSTSRTRRSSEETKQSIRDNRARERSRSRSNTRQAQMAFIDNASHVSVAPSTSLLSRESSITTEKTRTSRRPSSGKASGTTTTNNKRSTTQELILLRHAARCPYGPDSTDKETRGKCPIHKQCAGTKELLGHMTMCHVPAGDGGCPYPGCDNSKGLLELIFPSGAPKGTLDAAAANKVPEPPGSPLVSASSHHRRPQAQDLSTTSLAAATSLKKRSDGHRHQDSHPKSKDPLHPHVSSNIHDDATTDSSRTAAASRDKSQSSGSKPTQNKKVSDIRSKSVPEDLEMGVVMSKKHEDHGIMDDDTLEQQSLMEMEQQSLLEKEIRARRIKRAPKVKHTTSSSSGNKSHGSSATQSQTSASTTTSELIRNSQTVAQEIKLKAEAMMSNLNPATTTTTEVDKKKEGMTSLFSSWLQEGNKWSRLGKFACLGFGITIILATIALMFLFVFGGDDWNALSDFVPESDATTKPPNHTESVSVEGAGTIPPWQVQNDVGASSPTMAPTAFAIVLPKYTTDVLDADQYNDEDPTPQTKAYRWIQSEQEFINDRVEAAAIAGVDGETASSLTVAEWKNRFALATLFFATSISGNWTHKKHWLSLGVSECEWSFYGCDDGDSLWITNNGVNGILPPEIGMLTKLRDMAITDNPQLTGPLPSELGLLHRTVSINLQGNSFTGDIPSEIGAMNKLRWLYLNNNKLSSIPTDLGMLSSLAYLWLNDNKISGQLDPNLFASQEFKYLQELMLHNNQFVGRIPPEIGMLPQIRFISLHKNALTGTIPTTLGLLSKLEVLKLHRTDLSGSVPDEVCLLKQRGTLKNLTVDCSKITCTCGCSCVNDKNEESLTTDTIVPATTPSESVITGNPAEPPTTISMIVEPTNGPTTASSVNMNEVSAQPSAALLTRPPTSGPKPTAAPTAVPSAVPSFVPSPTASPSFVPQPTSLPTIIDQEDPDELLATEGTTQPTTAPTTASSVKSEPSDATSIAADFVLQLPDYTKDALLDADSPQILAFQWLQTDPKLDQYSLERKLQRFAMATIFYSTNGTEWFENDEWLSYDTHECDWYSSVESEEVCTEDSEDTGDRFVTDFMQWGNNLRGPLPREISLLTSLEKLFLGINNITSLPSEIGLLSNSLRVLNMMQGALHGSLFSELGELTLLKKLDLSENFLEGTIPSELGLLPLENLYLNNNMFAGTLPAELFDLPVLEGFNVAANALSGTLPAEVSLLTHIQWFNVYGNWIEGPIPSEMGLLQHMVAMHASHNLLSGPIPTELGLLSTSHSLSLDLRYNSFVGTIPSELGTLTNLVVLALEGSPELKGEMPGPICQLAVDWELSTLSMDCELVHCNDAACLGGDTENEICLCPELESFDDDGQDGEGNRL